MLPDANKDTFRRGAAATRYQLKERLQAAAGGSSRNNQGRWSFDQNESQQQDGGGP